MSLIITLLKIALLIGTCLIVYYFVFLLYRLSSKIDVIKDKENVIKAFQEYRKKLVDKEIYGELSDVDNILTDLKNGKRSVHLKKYDVITEYNFDMSDPDISDQPGIKFTKKYSVKKIV